MRYLESFCIPLEPRVPRADRNEISISDDSDSDIDREDFDSSTQSVQSFTRYGIGALQFHGLLKELFPARIKRQISQLEARRLLSQFSFSVGITSISSENFGEYLCQHYGVKCCSELGISLSDDLKHDILALRHVSNSEPWVSSLFQSPSKSCIDSSDENKSSKRLKICTSDSAALGGLFKLIPSSHIFPSDYTSNCLPSDLKMNKIRQEKGISAGEEIPFNDFEFCLPMFSGNLSTSKDIGHWGEALIYQYILSTHTSHSVTWLNSETESRAFYDILLESKEKNGLSSTRFIEVKTTTSVDKNVFQLSPWEYDFLSSHPRPNYDIYRVYGAPGSIFRPRIVVYRDVYKLLQEKTVGLCLLV